MQKYSILSAIMILLCSASASADGLLAQLIEYDADSMIARLQIANTDNTDYHNVSIRIDQSETIMVAGVLRSRTAVIRTIRLNPERHIVSIYSNEAEYIQDIFAQPTADLRKKQLEELAAQKARQQEKKEELMKSSKTSISFTGIFGMSALTLSLALAAIVILAAVLILMSSRPKSGSLHAQKQQFRPRPIPQGTRQVPGYRYPPNIRSRRPVQRTFTRSPSYQNPPRAAQPTPLPGNPQKPYQPQTNNVIEQPLRQNPPAPAQQTPSFTEPKRQNPEPEDIFSRLDSISSRQNQDVFERLSRVKKKTPSDQKKALTAKKK